MTWVPIASFSLYLRLGSSLARSVSITFMDRRKALRRIGLLSSGLILFPGCDLTQENVTRVMNKFEVTDKQEALMKELVASLIPETEIPGAGHLNVQDFVWVMADDCLEEDLQDSYLRGLQGFNNSFGKAAGKDFDGSEQGERIAGLNALMEAGSDGEVEHVQNFIEITKAFVILGYTQSEYFMTEVMPYTLIPGKNPECRTVYPNEKINVNA